MLDRLDMLMWEIWFNVTTGIQNIVDDERGDTNFISIMIILGIVIIIAGTFMVFSDDILEKVNDIVEGFDINLDNAKTEE